MSHTFAAQGLRLRAGVFLLLLLAAFGARSAAASGNAAPWTVRTAANQFGADRPTFGYTINPGGRVEDGLVVVNHGTEPLRLGLYAADAFTTQAGRLGLLSRGTEFSHGTQFAGIGAWVRAGRSGVTVGPGASVEVPFAIAVPAHAAPGDYVGGIVTAPVRDGGDASRRVGIRIRLRVGGALQPGLAVENVHVGYSGTANPAAKGDATVSYTIHNTGNAILTAKQAVSVSGPFGRWAAAAGSVPDSPSLLPGDTWKVSVPVRGVAPALRLTAKVSLVPLLTDAAGSTAALAATGGSGRTWAIPWTLLLGVVVLCGLVAAGVALALRRRGDSAAKDGHALPE